MKSAIKHYRLSYQRKLMFSYILMVVLPLVAILTVMIFVLETSMKEQFGNTMQQTVGLSSKILTNEFGKVVELSNNVYNNSVVQSTLKQKNEISYYQFERSALQLRNALDDMISLGSNSKITIYYDDDTSYKDWSSNELQSENVFKESSIYKSLEENDDPIKWALTTLDQAGFKMNYVVLVRNIEDPETGEHIGSMAIYYDLKNLSQIVNGIRIGKHGFAFVIDETGKILAHHNEKLLFTQVNDKEYFGILQNETGVHSMNIDNNAYMFAISPIGIMNLRMIGVLDSSELFDNIKKVMKIVIPIAMLTIIVVILVSIWFSKLHAKRINTLCSAMAEVEEGKLDIKVEVNDDDEISFLTNGFNKMLERIRELIENIQDTEHKKRIADFRVLHEQINPHFLYNCLDSINWLAESKEKNSGEKVSEMVTSLADMLRLGLSKGRDIITVREEVKHSECYINIQKIRFDESFRVEWIIDESTYDLKIIKILLQPLIENTITHGFVELERQGIISIKIFVEEEKLFIEVSDNGLGCTDEEVSSLINAKYEKAEKTGYGLYNIDERIKLYYGPEWGLTVRKNDDAGLTVTIRLPVITL